MDRTRDTTAPGAPGDAPDDSIVPLADGFAPAGRAEWEALVAGVLKGRPAAGALETPTYEGVTLKPLYRREDAPAPARPPAGPDAAGRVREGWDIRQLHARPDPAAANADIRADLDGGASSIVLRLDGAARRGAAAEAGSDGIVARTAGDFDAALAGVDLGAAAITLAPGAAAPQAAAMLLALARRRGVAFERLRGSFGADPLGALAGGGALPGPPDRQLAATAALAAWCEARAPGMRAIGIDTAPYHDAGATETRDLAFAMATAVAYLRALTGAGMGIDAACRRIGFDLPVGADVFQAIAKLRAARRLWARVAGACGAGAGARTMALSATTATRMLSRRDAWSNVLRATTACFAAGAGGADAVTVRPHSEPLGVAEPFARRIARNIQTILVRESSLARVADPAGGSWYVERLTEECARRAWTLFQEIEAAGGMAEALLSGRAAEWVAADWEGRARNLARGRDALTGVSSFPDLDERPPPAGAPEAERPAPAAGAAGIALPAGAGMDALIDAADRGAGLAALLEPFAGAGAPEIAPLAPRRLGEGFEALRDASDARLAARGRRPTVFLARLGAPAEYAARAAFARSYFAAGGFAAAEADVAAGAAGAAFAESGAELAAICSSDTIYEAEAAEAARSLKAAGAPVVALAGRPGAREAGLREAGVDRFVHAGDDMLGTLRALAAEIGTIGR